MEASDGESLGAFQKSLERAFRCGLLVGDEGGQGGPDAARHWPPWRPSL